jgi:hypothetical protein
MAQKNYPLVYWPKERKYSVIRTNDIKSKIADIGETVSVRWSEGNTISEHQAKTVAFQVLLN